MVARGTLDEGEVTGDEAADTVHHVLPSSAASQSSTPPSDIARSPDLPHSPV